MDYILLTVTLELMVASIQANPAGYMGCFDDDKDRTLSGYHTELNPNGARYCSTLCKDQGFRYAGTELSSFCFCGNEIRRKDQNSLNCDHLCTNNVQETCGGDWKISIYDTWHNTMGFLGCYIDYNNDRTLNQIYTNLDPNGARYCTTFCLQHGYRYAGTEYYFECHCGNEIRGQVTGMAECDHPCRNNTEENCGGGLRISIYDTRHYTTTPAPSTSPSTTTIELPTTTDLVELSETSVVGTNMASSTSLYEQPKDTKYQTVPTVYIAVACGVVVMAVVVLFVLLICRRRKMKANKHGTHVMDYTEHTNNEAENNEPNNVSFVNVGTTYRSTTLYDNEHVIMTADGEHVNIEFHATQPIDDCSEYNTLCLKGKNGVQNSVSSAGPNQIGGTDENTYSHLNGHINELHPSGTYSQGTWSRLNDKSNVGDNAYSHLGQAERQSAPYIVNGMSPDAVYNTLDNLPKTTDRRKNMSDFKVIDNVHGEQVYKNIKTDTHVKGVGLDEDNYAHVLNSNVAKPGQTRGMQPHTSAPSAEDNIYAKVDKKSHNTHASENSKADQSKLQYYEPENVVANKQMNDYYNDDNTYYNV